MFFRISKGYQRNEKANQCNFNCIINFNVKEISLLISLFILFISESCFFDVMHFIFLSFIKDLYILFNDRFFKFINLNNHHEKMTKSN